MLIKSTTCPQSYQIANWKVLGQTFDNYLSNFSKVATFALNTILKPNLARLLATNAFQPAFLIVKCVLSCEN